jgi:hypothetical protein
MKLTKQELRLIISKEWEERRADCRKKSQENSARTKKWKALNHSKLKTTRIKSIKTPVQVSSGIKTPTPHLVTLSLLVSVTYARES